MEKLIPQNVEAEQAVLGSLLIDPDAWDAVSVQLQAADFYRDTHRTIYAAAQTLWDAGTPADLLTLTDELARTDQLDAVGGASTVSSLANRVPTSANAAYYAGIVARTAINRRLIQAAGAIAGMAYNDPEGSDALEQAERLIAEIATKYRVAAPERTLRGVIGDVLAAAGAAEDARRDGTPMLGVPSGLRDLDRLTGGWQKSDLDIIAARPAMGKTSLALTLAANAALRSNRKPLIFSLEMNAQQLGQRLLAMQSGVDMQRIRLATLDDDDWAALQPAAGRLAEADVLINDTAGISLQTLRSRARAVRATFPFDLIIIDYLQLMSARNAAGRPHENRQQEVSEIARGLKNLARELDVPILALSQLSRSVEGRTDKVPMLSDLRESGEIEQAADVVIFIYRDDVYNDPSDRPNVADLIIAKHRNGPVGTVSCYFQKATASYRNLAMGDAYAGVGAGPTDARSPYAQDDN